AVLPGSACHIRFTYSGRGATYQDVLRSLESQISQWSAFALARAGANLVPWILLPDSERRNVNGSAEAIQRLLKTSCP
nr:hypothetical protein [Tanacetum cinerariifolium]